MSVGLVFLLTFLASSGLAQTPSLTPCVVRGLTGEVLCGSVRVAEDSSRPSGRMLDIAVVVARATGNLRQPDPMVFLAGGPGQAATEAAGFAGLALARVREQRDLVLIDVRGTGRSHPLTCALARKPEDLGERTLYPAESIRQCRDSLSRMADLRQYSTAIIADDLEAVRRAFGWPPLNFYGTSYGTRLALTYLRRHPAGVRAMVLKAVAPPSMTVPMDYAADAERAWRLLLRDCRLQVSCQEAFPSLQADLDSVLARAASGQIKASVLWERDSSTATFSREAVAAVLLGAMQSVNDRGGLPLLVHGAAQGDAGPLAALIVRYRGLLERGIAIGMHLSTLCADDGRHLDLAAARRDDGETFLGGSRVRMLANACRDWPAPVEDPQSREPVRAAVPVLLVSGELDPNTPPRHAEAALRFLPKGRHVVLKGVAHAWTNVEACGSGFVSAFIASASVSHLDLSCAARASALPFRTPPE